jgi:diphosphomevalonate decarboxylase
MKFVAKAPANIAFVKYWGTENKRLRIPANGSVSMNLSNVYSITSVEFSAKYKRDLITINSEVKKGEEGDRVVQHLDRIRKIAKLKLFAKVESENNFPEGTGIASSASGFAALTLAATRAAGLSLSERKLSTLARLGSGSACRSIPDGFAEWKKGTGGNSSYACSLYPPSYWEICDVIAIVSGVKKKVSSTKGHALAGTSPFYQTRIANMPKIIKEVKAALKNRDFTKFGYHIEQEALNMHAVMMTQKLPLLYWLPETLKIMHRIEVYRNEGLECYFTLDAGPNVHIICRSSDRDKLKKRLVKMDGVKKVIVNTPSRGAHLLQDKKA